MVTTVEMAGLEESPLRVSTTPDRDACWGLLERLAASPQLKRSVRLQELLFYIGKRYLKDGCERVHEQEIGSQVFKRPDSYDTSFDNIVRTNVSDLRKRIENILPCRGSARAVDPGDPPRRLHASLSLTRHRSRCTTRAGNGKSRLQARRSPASRDSIAGCAGPPLDVCGPGDDLRVQRRLCHWLLRFSGINCTPFIRRCSHGSRNPP